MSVLELAYASGQMAAITKTAWMAPTDSTVRDSAVLRRAETPPMPQLPPPPQSPDVVKQTFNLHEQGKTRVEPSRKLSSLDSMKLLTEGTYATHGPEGVVRMIGANPALRGPMLGHVRNLAGAASMRPQQGAFSGIMQTQSLPLRAAASGKIGAELCTTCRKERHYGPCSAPRKIPEKMADFNAGMTAADSTDGGPSMSPHYHAATTADSSLARARDGRPADEQAGTMFADLYRHLGITSQTDEPGRQYGGLHKVSGIPAAMRAANIDFITRSDFPAPLRGVDRTSAAYKTNASRRRAIAATDLLGDRVHASDVGHLLGRDLARGSVEPGSQLMNDLIALGRRSRDVARAKLGDFFTSLPGAATHSMHEQRGPGMTSNPYEERLTVKSPPVGWADEGPQRTRRAFDQVDGAVDTTNIENVTPDPGPLA